MRHRTFTPCRLAAALLVCAPLSAQTGVTLSELTELAKKRSEELRPALLEKLAPHIKVLELQYKTAFVDIENEIDAVVKLGDSVIPLLLEKLQPGSGSPKDRNLAANCARVLARMEPASFLDALLEIANGEDYTGRGHAIPLLGETGSSRAGALLTRLLDRLEETEQTRITVAALKKLGHGGAALKLAKRLPEKNEALDREIVRYLEVVKNPVVVPEILRSLADIKNIATSMRYIELLGKCASRHEAAAHKLLLYLDNNNYDVLYWGRIVDILGTVAPVGDKKTIERLTRMVKSTNPSSLELQAAVTLRELGDTAGPDALRKTLLRLTSRGKKHYLPFANLADFCMEFGEFRRAAHNYGQAVRYAVTPSLRSHLYLRVAQAQARRPSRSTEVRNALRDSGATEDTIRKLAAEDPALARALKTPTVKKWMDSFK